ncbi:DUF1433 domain-containing protein [Priestia koreensis]|uniref:DUF1433 domain-containing protein n=1 Tax=Priestia koreensis TaxID=284581 RepID=UPI003018BE99
MKYASLLALIFILTGCGLSPQPINARQEQVAEQKEAERYGEKMKPAIKELLKEEDINHFITSIHFDDDVYINPMGRVIVAGYVNDNPKYSFSVDLLMTSKEVDNLSASPELAEEFIDKEEEARLLKEAQEEDRNSGNSNE